LQNPNPQAIFYHIHDENQWLPLVTDLYIPHPRMAKDEEEKEESKIDESKQ
jgi:hypothetical protein